MSDKKMYDILGKWNNLEPKLTKVDTPPQVNEEVAPNSLIGHIQKLEEKYMGYKKGEMDESALQAYLGKKKYGEQGMKALQQAGRDGASKEKMAKIRAKHDKMDEAAKPDFLDIDKDGNKKEPMKKAAKDVKQVSEGKMKDLAMDLKELSEAEFKKKYGKTKAEMRKSLSEAREMKDKDEFDRRAKVGDYYVTKTGNKVTKTKTGIKHERGYKKEKDEDLVESLVTEAADQEKTINTPKGEIVLIQREYDLDIGPDQLTQVYVPRGMSRREVEKYIGSKVFDSEDEDGEYQYVAVLPDFGTDQITEKAKSTAQQKFMGMVYAAKKGEKPASAAVAKAAKGMSKSDAKDFAKTKHKGLPQHVKESRQMNEGHDIRKHPIYTTQEAWDHYAQELAEQEMSQMEADMAMEEPLMDAAHELDEIARLAGLPQKLPNPGEPGGPPAEINLDMKSMGNNPVTPLEKDSVKSPLSHVKEDPLMSEQSTCMECGMYEAECSCEHEPIEEVEEMGEGNEFSGALASARAAGQKEFEVDGKTYKVKESYKPVKEDINLSVSANGPDDVLSVIQKLAGMPVLAVTSPSAPTCGEALEEDGPKEREIEYTNSPREDIAAPEAAYPSGNDLNRSKHQYKKEYPGDNPMAVKEEALWKKYESMIKSIKG